MTDEKRDSISLYEKETSPDQKQKVEELISNSAFNALINRIKNSETQNQIKAKLANVVKQTPNNDKNTVAKKTTKPENTQSQTPKTSNSQLNKVKEILTKSSVANSINSSLEKHRAPKTWCGIVNVAVIEAKNLKSPKFNVQPDSHVRLKLGLEKFKTKTKCKTANPKWAEEFDMYLFDDIEPILEITIRDNEMSKSNILGECTVDLDKLEKDTTHRLNLTVDDDDAVILILLTITSVGDSSIDSTLDDTASELRKENDTFSFLNTASDLNRVGWAKIEVIKAVGLSGVDFSGTSDPFCVVQLNNNRVQTQTIYKTVDPVWEKSFNMNITDIHSTFIFTVYDENKNRKVDFLGRIAIPILKAKKGEEVWYQLKDKQLMNKMKGIILLKITYVYNPLRAAIRTFKPKEEFHMQKEPKLKISLMKRNVERAKEEIMNVAKVATFIQSCLSWESRIKSFLAYIIFCLIVWNFQLYMLPLSFILIMAKNIALMNCPSFTKDTVRTEGYEDEADDDLKEEKKSIVEKFQNLQEVGLMVQEILDKLVCYCERIRNLFQWKDPWLTVLALIILTLATIILFLVDIRILLFVWGTKKFSKKLFDLNYVDNNELLDFLDRLPSDKELIQIKALEVDYGLLETTNDEQNAKTK